MPHRSGSTSETSTRTRSMGVSRVSATTRDTSSTSRMRTALSRPRTRSMRTKGMGPPFSALADGQLHGPEAAQAGHDHVAGGDRHRLGEPAGQDHVPGGQAATPAAKGPDQPGHGRGRVAEGGPPGGRAPPPPADLQHAADQAQVDPVDGPADAAEGEAGGR